MMMETAYRTMDDDGEMEGEDDNEVSEEEGCCELVD